MNICTPKLITFTNSFIRSNFRLIRTSQYLSQFLLDVRHKSNKNNVVSDALLRLNNTNSLETKNYLELNALYVYNITLIKFSDDFKNRITEKYASDSK